MLKLSTRIKQSRVRVRTGTRLVSYLLLLAACVLLFGAPGLAKLAGVAAGFFTFVTLLEYWNARRLEKRRDTYEP